MFKVSSLWLLLAFPLSCSYLENLSRGTPITISGRIYITGNEPFTEVALACEDGKIYVLRGSRVKELRALQGKIVEIKGKWIKRATEEKGVRDVIIVENFKEESKGGP